MSSFLASTAVECLACRRAFNLFRRKITCETCQFLFCSSCMSDAQTCSLCVAKRKAAAMAASAAPAPAAGAPAAHAAVSGGPQTGAPQSAADFAAAITGLPAESLVAPSVAAPSSSAAAAAAAPVVAGSVQSSGPLPTSAAASAAAASVAAGFSAFGKSMATGFTAFGKGVEDLVSKINLTGAVTPGTVIHHAGDGVGVDPAVSPVGTAPPTAAPVVPGDRSYDSSSASGSGGAVPLVSSTPVAGAAVGADGSPAVAAALASAGSGSAAAASLGVRHDGAAFAGLNPMASRAAAAAVDGGIDTNPFAPPAGHADAGGKNGAGKAATDGSSGRDSLRDREAAHHPPAHTTVQAQTALFTARRSSLVGSSGLTGSAAAAAAAAGGPLARAAAREHALGPHGHEHEHGHDGAAPAASGPASASAPSGSPPASASASAPKAAPSGAPPPFTTGVWAPVPVVTAAALLAVPDSAALRAARRYRFLGAYAVSMTVEQVLHTKGAPPAGSAAAGLPGSPAQGAAALPTSERRALRNNPSSIADIAVGQTLRLKAHFTPKPRTNNVFAVGVIADGAPFPGSASVKLAKSPSDGRVFVLVNFSRQAVIKLYGAMDDTAAVGGRWVAVDHASGTEFSGSVRLVETVPGEDGEAEDEDDEPDFATAAAALGITMSSLEGETAPATGDDFASKSSSTGTAGGAGAGMAAVAEDHDHDHDEDSKREDERAAEEAVVAARMAAAAAAAAASGGAVPDAASAAATAAALAGAAPAAGAGSSAAGSAGAGAGAGDDAASRQKALTARFQSQRALFRKVSHRSGLAAAVAEDIKDVQAWAALFANVFAARFDLRSVVSAAEC